MGPMLFAITFPAIAPEIFSIEVFGVTIAPRWYALAYLAGIAIGWFLVWRALETPRLWTDNTPAMKTSDLENLVTFVVLGIIIGGRLGFVFFYAPAYYLENPLEIPLINRGGMAFHGGLIGVAVAGLFFAWRHKVSVASLADLLALASPAGIMLGRITNFVNGELWGRPTTLPWGVIFPDPRAQVCPGFAPPCARHPSQLYEATLEGLLLGLLLIWMVWMRGWFKIPGAICGLFLAGYGIGRFIVEFFRQADPQFITPENPIGFVLYLSPSIGVTMGQLLSLPMVVLGLAVLAAARMRAA